MGSVFCARWRNVDGKLIEESTGEYNPEKAQSKANKMEAEARFWEDLSTFKTYAQLNYSPRYCHESFIAAKHMRFDRFRELLVDAGVEFVPASKWRDTKKKTRVRGKRYRYEGRLLSLSQIIEQSGCGLCEATVRYRLEKKWSMDDALNTSPLTP
jgi:hypothetical protein